MLYSELQCSEAIHKAVERMGFAEMTEVQEKTIPVMLVNTSQAKIVVTVTTNIL